MSQESIDANLITAYEQASLALIESIKRALENFKEPKEVWEKWEKWKSPIPWIERVLPNLELYHISLENAKKSFNIGNLEQIIHVAAAHAGIAKDIDFDTKWMQENDRIGHNRKILVLFTS
ncbi:MAG: hypothetical protein WCL30_02355 [Pseudomonadota bacterium]